MYNYYVNVNFDYVAIIINFVELMIYIYSAN